MRGALLGDGEEQRASPTNVAYAPFQTNSRGGKIEKPRILSKNKAIYISGGMKWQGGIMTRHFSWQMMRKVWDTAPRLVSLELSVILSAS